FTYGNYEHYYGYRDSGSRLDPRLAVLDAMLFQGKRVLDIGCNAGLLTVSIAMLFGPAVVEGVDIDPTLVRKARAHLAYRSGEQAVGDQEVGDAGEIDYDYFPASCAAMFGTLPIPADATDYILDAKSSPPFPSNIRFRCGNWLYEPPPRSNDARYHTILALSITKWIHLNWGDAGLCSFFSRCYDALLPGGHLVLEPQPFDSYGKRSNLTPDMHKHYANIKLRPEMFAAHLLSSRVGFRSMSQV
ncbi:Bicoid-interacting protein 3-domain-containing protein, partial [Entophlyctis helioformis]